MEISPKESYIFHYSWFEYYLGGKYKAYTQDLVVQWYYLREGRSAVRLAGRGRRAQGP